MAGFPDESRMPRSEDNSEPIRGGSVGFNRVLGYFAAAANQDNRPRFDAVLISAFTIVRNVLSSNSTASFQELEEGFSKDVNLFLEYFNEYLATVWQPSAGDKFCPVIIYFPNYHRVPKEIQRDLMGAKATLFAMYDKFKSKHGGFDKEVRKLTHSRCFTIDAGHATYPHREVVRKFKDITAHPLSLHTSNGNVCLITHMTLDYYIAGRLRGVQLLESYTGRTRKPDEFRMRLDKEGRVPFQQAVHVTLGDSELIRPMVSTKIKKLILETASKERWVSRNEDDVRSRISKLTDIPIVTFRKYDFL